MVILLKYVKEDLEGSEKDFHDSYVEQLQKVICEIKGSKEWVKELKQHTQLALQSKSLEELVLCQDLVQVKMRFSSS